MGNIRHYLHYKQVVYLQGYTDISLCDPHNVNPEDLFLKINTRPKFIHKLLLYERVNFIFSADSCQKTTWKKSKLKLGLTLANDDVMKWNMNCKYLCKSTKEVDSQVKAKQCLVSACSLDHLQ